MSPAAILLPGDLITPEDLPQIASSPALKLGPGLLHTYPSRISSTTAGPLTVESRKNIIYIPASQGRYIPSTGDLVIATVHHSASEYFHCTITPHTSHALLGHLAFEGATKKTRPQLQSGALIYARVLKADKNSETELVCYNPSTAKSEGMGELKGGMVFDVSLGMARRLLMRRSEGGVACLEVFAGRLAFEIAVGRNGKVWVRCDDGGVKGTSAVGRVLQESDEKALTEEEQKKLARKLLNS